MPSILDSVHKSSASLGPYYKEALHANLASLWQRKQLIAKAVGVALALGIIASFAMPVRYTAEAYVYGDLAAPHRVTAEHADGGPFISFDASLLVETRSRLIQSHQLARQVVGRLGLERLRTEVGGGLLSSWLQTLFYGKGAHTPGYREDIAARRLLRGLSVKTEPRVYLIAVRYSSGNPELAATITNAFVTEYLRVTMLQTLAGRRAAAKTALEEERATFGDKHPNVAAAKVRLAVADALFKAQFNKTPEELESSSGENVTFARSVAVPSGPNPPLIIGAFLLIGLVAGFGLAYWVEGRAIERQSHFSERRQTRRSKANQTRAAKRTPAEPASKATQGESNSGPAYEREAYPVL